MAPVCAALPPGLAALLAAACAPADVAAGATRTVYTGAAAATCAAVQAVQALPMVQGVVRGFSCCPTAGCNAPATVSLGAPAASGGVGAQVGAVGGGALCYVGTNATGFGTLPTTAATTQG